MASRINWRFWEREQGGCAGIEPLLSLYVDHMASPAETRRVDAHLSVCPECRQVLQWMQATHQVIARRPIVAPPPDLSARIAQAIAATQAGKAGVRPVQAVHAPRRTLTFRPALAYGLSLALVAAVSGSIFLTGSHQNTHPPTVAANSGHPGNPIVTPVPIVHHPSGLSVAQGGAPSDHPRIIRLRPVVASPKIANLPSEKTPGSLKPHRLPISNNPQPTLAETPSPSSSSPTPIKTNVFTPQRLPQSSAAHDNRPQVASRPAPKKELPLPKKVPLVPESPGANEQIAGNIPVSGPGPQSVHVDVGAPTITPSPVHLATASLSLTDQLHAIAGKIDAIPAATTGKFEAEESTVATAVGSGTLDIVHGPMH